MSKSKPQKTATTKFNHKYIYLFLVLCTFLFYGNSLKNQYNIDDQFVIDNNSLVQKGIIGIPKIFVSHYVDNELEKHSYRPITTTSFAIEYQFFGANPFISHLINLLLYAFCCILIFRLVTKLDISEEAIQIASLAAFIFLILPVHSEVVNNVKSRDELLSLSFGLLSLLLSLNYLATSARKDLFLSLFYFLISLLSKQTTMTLIALIPFTLGYFKQIEFKKLGVVSFVAILIFAVPKFFNRFLVTSEGKIRKLMEFENPLFDASYSFADRIPVGFTTVGKYLEMILFPTNLSCYYGYDQIPISRWGDANTWISIIFILGILSTIIYSWKKHKLLTFGLIWFLVSISMFTNVVKPVVGIIADRFAFMPSVGIAISLATLIYHFTKSNYFKKSNLVKYGLYFACALIIGMSWYKVVNRNTKWYDKKTLYTNDVKIAPKSAKLHNLLANNLFREIQGTKLITKRKQLVKEAISHYNSCVKIFPKYATAWNNLGTLILNENKTPKKALSCFQNAIKYKDQYITALYGAGYSCELLGNHVKAIKYYEDVTNINPNFQDIRLRMSTVNAKASNSKNIE